MNPVRRDTLILGGFGLAAAAVGAVVGALVLQARSGAADLLGMRFEDLSGKPRRLLEWQGRALLCNFWATWCTPCREEIPLLVEAKRKHAADNLEIVGIGIDSAAKIGEFADMFKINYPLLVAGAPAIDLLRALGNRQGALPYTVVVDRRGTVAYRHLGALNQRDLGELLAALLG